MKSLRIWTTTIFLKLKIYLTLFLFAFSSSAFATEAKGVSNIECLQSSLSQQLARLNLKNVESERLRVVIHTFRSMINQREKLIQKQQPNHIPYFKTATVNEKLHIFSVLFEQTAKTMLSSNRIYYINDELINHYNLDKYLCNPELNCAKKKECKKLKAFYVPLVDAIFVNPDLTEVQFEQALFHEILHAYQYRYRFPLDMAALIKAAKDPEAHIKQEQILNYLSLIYESESAWYEIQANLPQNWAKELRSYNRPLAVVNKLRLALTSSLWHWGQLLVPGETASQPGLQSFIDILPDVDKLSSSGPDMSSVYSNNEPNALYFHEQILYKFPDYTNLIGNIDIHFHKKLADSLECTYYGKLDFLFETIDGNQKVIKTAHNLYYDKILTSSFVSGCAKELEKLFEKNGSPFVTWLTQPYENLGAICPGLNEYLTPELQSEIANIYFSTPLSPFKLITPGVEGGSGGLDLISPSLQFHPQFELHPVEENSEGK